MAHYISSMAKIENGRPVFESLSELDGKIIAWDEKCFSSLMMVGQQGKVVFVAESPEDLINIGHQVADVGPSMCLIERRFFEANFKQKTTIVGRVKNG